MAVSQNGWDLLEPDSPLLYRWVVPGADRTFLLVSGAPGFVLIHLALWFHEQIQPLNKAGDLFDEGGYAIRIILGSTTPSNHQSGTAVDLNATRYPLGTELMRPWRVAKILLRMAFYGGVLKWGGSFIKRKDQMHFEINKDRAACEVLAQKLAKTKRGVRILSANPTQRI